MEIFLALLLIALRIFGTCTCWIAFVLIVGILAGDKDCLKGHIMVGLGLAVMNMFINAMFWRE